MEDKKLHLKKNNIRAILNFVSNIHRKYRSWIYLFIVLTLVISLSISGCFAFFIYKHRALIGQLAKDGYSFNTSAVVMVKLDAPVSVNAPVKQNFKVPFKEVVHVKAPVKTQIPVHINKIFSIQTDNPIQITIDHKFPLNEIIRIDTVFPVNSEIDATVFGLL